MNEMNILSKIRDALPRKLAMEHRAWDYIWDNIRDPLRSYLGRIKDSLEDHFDYE